MQLIRSAFDSFRTNPVKSVVTMLTVALGAGVLILAVSMSDVFRDLAEISDERNELIVTIGNVETNSEGEFAMVRPPELDGRIADLVRTDVPGVQNVSQVTEASGRRYLLNGQEYQIRSVVGTAASYFEIFGMEPVAGAFFTAEEVESISPVVVISESLARLVYGSADAALGQTVTSPVNMMPGPAGEERRRISMPTLEIIGVYEDLTDLQREAYGIGDMIVPLYSALPAGLPTHILEMATNSILQVSVTGQTIEQVAAAVHQLVEQEYGDDVSVEVWEGTPSGSSETLQQIRDTTATFSLIVNLLGIVLLVSGSIGIFSIMMVDVVSRVREMALERALGASQRRLLMEFLFRSAVFAVVSGLVGTLLAMLTASPMRDLVLPLFVQTDAGGGDFPTALVSLKGVVVGLGATIGLGAVFGLVPVMNQIQLPIADGLREV